MLLSCQLPSRPWSVNVQTYSESTNPYNWKSIIEDVVRKPDFYLSEDEETGEKKPAGWGFLTDDGWRRLQGSDGEDDDEEEEGSDFAEERALYHYLLLASALHGVPWSIPQLTATMVKKRTTTRKTSATLLTLKMMTSAWLSRVIGVCDFSVTAL